MPSLSLFTTSEPDANLKHIEPETLALMKSEAYTNPAHPLHKQISAQVQEYFALDHAYDPGEDADNPLDE